MSLQSAEPLGRFPDDDLPEPLEDSSDDDAEDEEDEEDLEDREEDLEDENDKDDDSGDYNDAIALPSEGDGMYPNVCALYCNMFLCAC
jgi:hypothetical protein